MDKVTINQKKAERLNEWKKWLSSYLETIKEDVRSKCVTITNAAELLNDYYWRLVKQFIRPLLQETINPDEHNIHYYKIISASELTVMTVLPLTFSESVIPEDRTLINADFAFFVASSIMLNWKILDKEIVDVTELSQVVFYKETIDISTENVPVYYPNNFRDEHIAWLKELNTHGPLPILSNSHTWRLCYHACMAIRNGGKL